MGMGSGAPGAEHNPPPSDTNPDTQASPGNDGAAAPVAAPPPPVVLTARQQSARAIKPGCPPEARNISTWVGDPDAKPHAAELKEEVIRRDKTGTVRPTH